MNQGGAWGQLFGTEENENSILLFYYIYFILILEFMWFIQK